MEHLHKIFVGAILLAAGIWFLGIAIILTNISQSLRVIIQLLGG